MLDITYLYQFLYFLTPTLASCNAVQIKIKVTLTEAKATSVHLPDFSPTSISKYSAGLLSIQSSPDCIDTGDCPDPGAGS